jgi:demethylmenaquinone methyltransferase/2-methoxy-6-polyprenyl-1,4-benzoquinol methylase
MSQEAKERFVRIAGKYDFMNHFLSMGIDRKWRLEAAREAMRGMIGKKSFRVLDSATGTGDLAFAVYDLAEASGRKVKIMGTDFVKEMLDIAIEKARDSGRRIDFKIGDSLRTGFKSGSFDVITTGFSLRNFDSVESFLAESHRILKRGGRLIILELALPDDPRQRTYFRIYSYFIKFASLFAGKEYVWLAESISKFDKKKLLRSARATGFKRIRMRPLPSGVAFLLVACK